MVTASLIHRQHLVIFAFTEECEVIGLVQLFKVAANSDIAIITEDDINLDRITADGEVRQAGDATKHETFSDGAELAESPDEAGLEEEPQLRQQQELPCKGGDSD